LPSRKSRPQASKPPSDSLLAKRDPVAATAPTETGKAIGSSIGKSLAAATHILPILMNPEDAQVAGHAHTFTRSLMPGLLDSDLYTVPVVLHDLASNVTSLGGCGREGDRSSDGAAGTIVLEALTTTMVRHPPSTLSHGTCHGPEPRKLLLFGEIYRLYVGPVKSCRCPKELTCEKGVCIFPYITRGSLLSMLASKLGVFEETPP
jgi:hypothetical protein